MTREEAIKALREILTEATEFENSVCYVTEEDREPLEIAIKALEHPEQNVIAVVPCGDAISRQEALKLFATNDGKYLYEAIRDLPSVTPKQTEITLESAIDYLHSIGWMQKHDKELTEYAEKQRTGHWERHYIRPKVYKDLFWYCSACGDKCGYESAFMFEYCPHCGAKMESEEQE